jgi:glutathione synthase/RimK-type ligase-like ATP-grasp enzyme
VDWFGASLMHQNGYCVVKEPYSSVGIGVAKAAIQKSVKQTIKVIINITKDAHYDEQIH